MPHRKTSRILVVEDNPTTQDALETFLREHGYVVDYAGNGEGALVRMEVHTPTVIVTDLYMPSMDGLTFLEKVRQVAAWQNIPTVLVTAAATDDLAELMQRIQDLHPVAILRKPFESQELLDLITEFCNCQPRADAKR